MDEEEYKKFLEELYRDFEHRKEYSIRDFRDWKNGFYQKILEEQKLLMRKINTINEYFKNEYDIEERFSKKALAKIVYDVMWGVIRTRQLATSTRMLHLVQDNHRKIREGLKAEYLPEKDFRVLEVLEKGNAREEMNEIIKRVKEMKCEKKVDLRKRLYELEEKLKKIEKKIVKQEKKKPKKRWFKGLGKICLGVILSLLDILSVLDIEQRMMLRESFSLAVISSVTVGLFSIIEAIGEFRGE